MAYIDEIYRDLGDQILEEGYEYQDLSRDKTCLQISSHTMEIPLYEEFPLLTTKKMYTRGIVAELIWFLRGDTNIKFLLDNNVNIWNKDGYKHYLRTYSGLPEDTLSYERWQEYIMLSDNSGLGNLGPVYGGQWRNFNTARGKMVDQIKDLIVNLGNKPMSRGHIVTAWNPSELHLMALRPCHWAFEVIPEPIPSDFGIVQDYAFTLKWHQRSVDTFLGLPFNITSYALLAKVIEALTDMLAKTLIGDLSNVHFYTPHIPAYTLQSNRECDTEACDFHFSEEFHKKVEFYKESKDLDQFFQSLEISDFIFENYSSHPAIKAEMYEPIE